MPGTFRVIAVDYDGTIATADRPHDAALRAIAELRRRAVRVLLCTGRIVEELREVFPEVERHFDAIVAENGAVIAHEGEVDTQQRRLAPELAESLRGIGVPLEDVEPEPCPDVRPRPALLVHAANLGARHRQH